MSLPIVDVREEQPGDREAIHRVEAAAFGREDEADLVDALRDTGKAVVSLVAVTGDEVLAHVLFSPVSVETGGGAKVLGMGPVAVDPQWQRQGIGAELVREGLERCRERGWDAVVVLGDPDYYTRFGFRPAAEHGLRCEYHVSPEAFMALELRPVALAPCEGLVRYAPEFGAV